VRELGCAEDDITDGVNARFGGLHPLVGFDEAAFGLNPRFLDPDAFSVWLSADGDQNLFGFDLLLLAVGAKGY
jgi:hypothetical protein